MSQMPSRPPGYPSEPNGLSASVGEVDITISPLGDSHSFQVGTISGDEERSFLKGEVLLKAISGTRLDKVTVIFRTQETQGQDAIELARTEQVIFSRPIAGTSSGTSDPTPSSVQFSIPLTADLPQAVSTVTSSLTHTLVAQSYTDKGTVHSKPFPVIIQRSSNASVRLPIDPVELECSSPSTFKAQIPRSTFSRNEHIPVYVTIPVPSQETIASGIRLRNVMVELVRRIDVLHNEGSSGTAGPSTEAGTSSSSSAQTWRPDEKRSAAADAEYYEMVIRRSGAACRFHLSREVKLRLILHQEDSGDDCDESSISQTTLLHRVSFYIRVQVSYTSAQTRVGSSVDIRFPVNILPPLLANPSELFSQEVEDAYHKKHDPPPLKTSRPDDVVEGSSRPPAFDEDGASSLPLVNHEPPNEPPPFSETSVVNNAAQAMSPPPPAFEEERQSFEPPSFEDASQSTNGTSSRLSQLPSFLESVHLHESIPTEDVVLMPRSDIGNSNVNGEEAEFPEEGETYGFRRSQVYDGISHALDTSESMMSGSNTAAAMMPVNQDTSLYRDVAEQPPPGVDESLAAGVQAAFDSGRLTADPTELAPPIGSGGGEGASASSIIHVPPAPDSPPPPPPPLLDDPSDPPPPIDEGVQSLSEEGQTRREVAMAEAAAAAATAAVQRASRAAASVAAHARSSPPRNAVGALPPPHSHATPGGAVDPSVPLTVRTDAAIVSVNARGRGGPSTGDAFLPPPYRGVASVSTPDSPTPRLAAPQGPPPYAV